MKSYRTSYVNVVVPNGVTLEPKTVFTITVANETVNYVYLGPNEAAAGTTVTLYQGTLNEVTVSSDEVAGLTTAPYDIVIDSGTVAIDDTFSLVDSSSSNTTWTRVESFVGHASEFADKAPTMYKVDVNGDGNTYIRLYTPHPYGELAPP